MVSIKESLPRVDVVVRTMADEARTTQLFRALDSIQSQEGILARPIVVVNGDCYLERVMKKLQARDGVLVHYFPEAAHGRAITVGRRLVTAPYFMYLDDDDYFVSGALKRVVPDVAADVDWDVLVTNGYGYRQSGGKRYPWVEDLMAHSRHPLRSLINENWLSPGSSLFRSSSISVELMDLDHEHRSWTHIAFRLVRADKRVKFLDIPTAVYDDTPGSKSKQLSYHEDGLRVLEEARMYPNLDPEIRAMLESKYRNALHTMAARYACSGQIGKAWRCHLRSLRPPYTLKYILFTRKLIFPKRAEL